MAIRVGINGFGRIGRLFCRAAQGKDIEIVGVNDLTDSQTLAHLLRYDSIHGRSPQDVQTADDALVIDGKKIPVSAERDPAKLPWKKLGAQIVLESTGRFVDRAGASAHLSAGAERVIISAPAKDPDVTIVLGVNSDAYAASSRLQQKAMGENRDVVIDVIGAAEFDNRLVRYGSRIGAIEDGRMLREMFVVSVA